ncbi:lysophospholipid acyltransferase family protein [Mariniluteicoccus flavus]
MADRDRGGDDRPDLGSLLIELAGAGVEALEKLRGAGGDQWRRLADDPWPALFEAGRAAGIEWQGSLEELVAFARQRISGDYAVDEFGLDPEFTERVVLPALRFLATRWFRIEVRGLENVPADGPALLVANHAGAMPIDALMVQSVVFDGLGRHSRMLGADLVFETPFSHDFARRVGATVACPEDAARLLSNGELVSVFPEGFKGLGKLYSERYRLQRFGRGGFVSTALRARAPIVPVSIVGSEEIYPLLSNAPGLAKTLGFPYFPITPLFPWFGVLGMIPLPSKWIIEFGEAITTDELGAHAADDPMTVFQITDQVRLTIQNRLYALLAQRPGVFL